MRRPLFIARQSGLPRGPLGRLIAAIMVRETASTNRQAIAALEIRPGDSALDIGCGSGLSVELLLRLVPKGRVTGADPSPVMAARAKARNYRAIASGLAEIATAPVEHLPFPDASFDAVMSVHTLYFWADLDIALREIVRVLRPGGRLVLACRTPANPAAAASFPAEIYTLRGLSEIEEALRDAGLQITASTADEPGGEPALIRAHKP
ncbi:MAG: class I SAM-dependent methyltransferase [Novosphingobium sp.]|uniref:class I SAM-dependent methyltransferase n=1 Tax=Novosphingobium sp. TaxID=1874826 RepID=UPI0032BBCAF4